MATSDYIKQALAGNIQAGQQFGSAFETGMKIAQAAEQAKMENAIKQEQNLIARERLKADQTKWGIDALRLGIKDVPPAQRYNYFKSISPQLGNMLGVEVSEAYLQTFKINPELAAKAASEFANLIQSTGGDLTQLSAVAPEAVENMRAAMGADNPKDVLSLMNSIISASGRRMQSLGLEDKELMNRIAATRSAFAENMKALSDPKIQEAMSDEERRTTAIYQNEYYASQTQKPSTETAANMERILQKIKNTRDVIASRISGRNSFSDLAKTTASELTSIQGVSGLQSTASSYMKRINDLNQKYLNTPDASPKELAQMNKELMDIRSGITGYKSLADSQATKKEVEKGVMKMVTDYSKEIKDTYVPLKRQIAAIDGALSGKSKYTVTQLNQLSFAMAKIFDSGGRLSNQDVQMLGIGNNVDEAKAYVMKLFGSPNAQVNETTLKEAKRISSFILGTAEEKIGSDISNVIESGKNYSSPDTRSVFTTGSGRKNLSQIIKREMPNSSYARAYSTPEEVMAGLRKELGKDYNPKTARQRAIQIIENAQKEIGLK